MALKYDPFAPSGSTIRSNNVDAPPTGGFIFTQNPYGSDIDRYEQGKYAYQTQTLQSPGNLYNQSFDQQRQGAQRMVNAGVESGNKTLMSQLAASGGLSAGDKAAIQRQGQRQKVSLSQGAMNPYDQMAAQNMYDTQRFNLGQNQMISDQNAAMQTASARDQATEYEKRAQNIYAQRMQEALLERQLEAARKIAGG